MESALLRGSSHTGALFARSGSIIGVGAVVGCIQIPGIGNC